MTIARALARSLKLPERLPQSSGRTSMLSAMGGLLGSGSQSGMQAYKDVGAAYGPIRRIAQSVALTNWSLYQQTEKAGKVDRVLVDDATAPARHPGTALWTSPNPFMSRRFFLLLTELWKIQAGGVYWVILQGGKEGSPFPQRGLVADIEVWPIRAEKIVPIPDPEQYLAGYWYAPGGGIQPVPLPVAAVIPIGWPDPLDPLQFAGPLQSIMTDLDAEKYASQYNRNTFINDARPGGVIEFETPLPRDRFEELVLRWREQHQGLNNAKRVAIIEGGKWVETGAKNSELEYEKLRHLTRETVMFAIGMPFAMMQSNDVNLANSLTAEKVFYRWTLRPELEDLKEPLNLRLLPLIGENLTMDYELPSPEDESFDVFAGTSGWLSGLLTQNQGLEALGYAALGDEGERYVWELPGTKPPTVPSITPPRPPRRPTNLSYRVKARHPQAVEHEGAMETAWTRRLAAIQQSYQDLLTQRNGHGN